MINGHTYVDVSQKDIDEADRLAGGQATKSDPFKVAVARHLAVSPEQVQVVLPRRKLGEDHHGGWIRVANYQGHRAVRAHLMHTQGGHLEAHRSGTKMEPRSLTLLFTPVS